MENSPAAFRSVGSPARRSCRPTASATSDIRSCPGSVDAVTPLALGLILPFAREQALPFVELTTDVANVPSQRVILHNGGQLFEHFIKPASHGGEPALRFRIQLS